MKAAVDAAKAAAAVSRPPSSRHRLAHEMNGMDLIAKFIGYAHEMLPSMAIGSTGPSPPIPGGPINLGHLARHLGPGNIDIVTVD